MFNIEKCDYCVEKLQLYFLNNQIDADVLVPENLVVNSLDYVLYIFYSCLLDYGMRSKIYHENLVKTYELHREIFNPLYVLEKYENDSLELYNIMKNNVHHRYPNVAVRKWINLSKFINENYPGEMLIDRITSINSYLELYEFITNIKGYGQKTGGLLLRLIYESGMCNIKGEIQNIPIDRHDIEISFLNGIIDNEKLSEKEIMELERVWVNSAVKYGVNACLIDKYLWSIGNGFCLKKRCLECPLNEACRGKING